MADIKLSTLASSGSTRKSEIFTASGTWTQPTANTTSIEYLLIGAGGGGENESGLVSAIGGSGGEFMEGQTVVSGDVTVTIGAGGLGGATGGDNFGASGGDSTLTGNIDNDIIAKGGGGGGTGDGGGDKGLNTNGVTSGASTAGTSSEGSMFAVKGAATASSVGLGGAGGYEDGGAGGDAGSTPTAATVGGIGAGGGGQARDGGAGDGGDGYCIIFWSE